MKSKKFRGCRKVRRLPKPSSAVVSAVPRGVVAMAGRMSAGPTGKMPVLQKFCDNMAP